MKDIFVHGACGEVIRISVPRTLCERQFEADYNRGKMVTGAALAMLAIAGFGLYAMIG